MRAPLGINVVALPLATRVTRTVCQTGSKKKSENIFQNFKNSKTAQNIKMSPNTFDKMILTTKLIENNQNLPLDL